MLLHSSLEAEYNTERECCKAQNLHNRTETESDESGYQCFAESQDRRAQKETSQHLKAKSDTDGTHKKGNHKMGRSVQ